jgi:hypothetical protein
VTQSVHMKRPEGEAAAHYELALKLERDIADAVHDYKLDEAERLRGLAKEAWAKYREASA